MQYNHPKTFVRGCELHLVSSFFLYFGYTFCFARKKHDNIFITQKNGINYIMEMWATLLIFFIYVGCDGYILNAKYIDWIS